jgi:hypothetical protein
MVGRCYSCTQLGCSMMAGCCWTLLGVCVVLQWQLQMSVYTLCSKTVYVSPLCQPSLVADAASNDSVPARALAIAHALHHA